MAEDEDRLPVEGADDAAHEDDAPVIEDTPEPVRQLAGQMGWVPKEQFRGDPDKWKPADQFILAGRDIQQATSRELREMREELGRFGRVAGELVESQVAERDAYWKAQHAKAVDEGDQEAALEAAKQIGQPATARQTGPDPKAAEWVAKNPWMNTDRVAAARARQIADELAKQGLTVEEQLQGVERIIRREYPENFPAPAKDPPATQTGASRNTRPGNRAKGYADMPPASQKMARDMVERHPSLTVEAIAKSYWADKEKVG